MSAMEGSGQSPPPKLCFAAARPSMAASEEAWRWGGLALATWLMLFSGSYSFSNYSAALKEVLDLNQKQLNRLGIAKDLGDALGVFAGILSTRLPPSALLSIGAVVSAAGYGVLWLVVSGSIDPPPFSVMFLATTIAGNGISWMNGSVFTVSMQNFPRNRGPVSGVLKAYMGLSAALYSALSDRFFPGSSSMYLLMLLVLVPSFSLAAAAFFRQTQPPAPSAGGERLERGAVAAFTAAACALAGYIVLQEFVPGMSEGGMVGILFALVAAPVGVAGVVVGVVARRRRKRDEEEEEEEEEEEGKEGWERKPLLEEKAAVEEEEAAEERRGRRRGCCGAAEERLGKDVGALDMLRQWDYYVLYVALFCGAGSGMAFANNLGQVVLSFGYDTATTFTSLFSMGNFVGRVVSGHASEISLRLYSTPRPLWMGISKLLMIVMFAWLSLGQMGANLYIGSFLIGICHGSLISLTIPIVSELYGIRFFGTNYMVTMTYLLTGSYVLSGIVAGYLYDIHASPDTLDCYGSSCFGTTFVVYCILLCLALFLDGLLTFLSRDLYRKLQRTNTP